MRRALPISAQHPAYADHFPGLPLLPGAVLLDHALHSIAHAHGLDLRQWTLTSMKFLGFVRPGDELTLEETAATETTLRFSVRVADRVVATGVLAQSAPPSEPADGR